MRLTMTSTRLVVLLEAYENAHSDVQSFGATDIFELDCLREDGLIAPFRADVCGTRTTALGDKAVEAILEAIQKIEIKEQL